MKDKICIIDDKTYVVKKEKRYWNVYNTDEIWVCGLLMKPDEKKDIPKEKIEEMIRQVEASKIDPKDYKNYRHNWHGDPSL